MLLRVSMHYCPSNQLFARCHGCDCMLASVTCAADVTVAQHLERHVAGRGARSSIRLGDQQHHLRLPCLGRRKIVSSRRHHDINHDICPARTQLHKTLFYCMSFVLNSTLHYSFTNTYCMVAFMPQYTEIQRPHDVQNSTLSS